MVIVFWYHPNEFLQIEENISRYIIDAENVEWVWELCKSTFYGDGEQKINISLFENGEMHREELQELNAYHYAGYYVTVVKCKTEFCNIRSFLMKFYSS